MAKRKGRPTQEPPRPTEPAAEPVFARAAERFVPFLPYLVFLVLVAGTWRRWFLPFQDTGRDVMTAARVADGERLIADVSCYYGPWPNLLDAAVLKVFGRHLDALVALRLVLALLGVEALRRLLKLLTGSGAAAGVGTAFVVAACFFQRLGGTYLFPYSVNALEGSVGTWWALVLALSGAGWGSALLAGAVAGLAAGTKVEFFAAAVAGVAAALFLRRPRAQAFAGAALAATLGLAAYAIPVALYGVAIVERYGFLIARHVPVPWTRLYRELFWAGGTSDTFLSRFWTMTLVPTAILVGGGLWAARRFRSPGPVGAAVFLLAGGAASFALTYGGISALVPFALVGFGLVLLRALARGLPSLKRLEPGTAALLATGVAMLPLAVRQPFSLITIPYSAFSAPLALVVAFALLWRLAPGAPGLLFLFAGITAAQGAHRVLDVHRATMREVRFPAGTFYLQENEATLLEETVEALKRRTPEGSYVAVFPESGMVLFLADRKNPFVDEQFLPGTQDEEKEREMIARLSTRKPAAAVIVNRALHEFGYRLFGAGYLTAFRGELESRMALAETLGKPDRTMAILPYPARADEGWLLLPK